MLSSVLSLVRLQRARAMPESSARKFGKLDKSRRVENGAWQEYPEKDLNLAFREVFWLVLPAQKSSREYYF